MQTEPQVKFRKAKVRIPVKRNGQLDWKVLNRADAAQHSYRAYQRGLPAAQRKPGRQLGATWIEDIVARRGNVNLCEECYRRYDRWWERHDYRPDFQQWKIGECDGCDKSFHYIVGFYPEGRSPFHK